MRGKLVRRWPPFAKTTVVIGLLGASLGCWAAVANAAEQARLDFVSPDKVSVSADKPSDTATVILRNNGPSPADVTFRVEAAKDAPTVSNPATTVPAFQIAHVELTLTPAKRHQAAKGVLVASAPGSVPAAVTLDASATKSPPWWVYAVIFGPLAIGLVLLTVRWLSRTRKDADLGDRVGPASWDFSKSWASTLTVFGALVGTIVTSGVLPDTSTTPKSTYAGLNVLFGALILIAPFVYTATQKAAKVHLSKTVKEPQYQGFVWGFLLATAITVWAVMGELATTFAMFEAIRTGHSMPGVAVIVLAAVVIIAAALLLLVTWRRVDTIIGYQTDKPKQRHRARTLHPTLLADMAVTDAEAAAPPTKDLIEPALPSWSIL
jgi:hypothetical protein